MYQEIFKALEGMSDAEEVHFLEIVRTGLSFPCKVYDFAVACFRLSEEELVEKANGIAFVLPFLHSPSNLPHLLLIAEEVLAFRRREGDCLGDIPHYDHLFQIHRNFG